MSSTHALTYSEDGNWASFRTETDQGRVGIATLVARHLNPDHSYVSSAYVVRPEGAAPDSPFALLEHRDHQGTWWLLDERFRQCGDAMEAALSMIEGIVRLRATP
jgi:hypothetical protein